MRRTRLFWFAGGLAVGIFVCGLAIWLKPLEPERELYLRLQGSGYDLMSQAERDKMPLDANPYETWKASPDARKRISASVLEEALACGGRKFGVDMPTHRFDIVIELTPENIKSSNCMLVSAKRHGIPFVISDSEK